MATFDYLIVGSGWFGAVFAREMTDAGYKCLVIERRSHIGGNCFTRTMGGIHVHAYGPHLFHTNSDKIWAYVNQFSSFTPFIYRGSANYQGRSYSFPINLTTLQQVFGVRTQAEAEERLAIERIPIESPKNLEEWALSQVGEKLYRVFIYGYTSKQWRRSPHLLPASIVKRLPIRTTKDDRYFSDAYQGIPEEGYTSIFEKLLMGSEVQLDVDYFAKRDYWDQLADRVVFTGKIDQFFDYQLGQLEYRTLRFDTKRLETEHFQESAIVNFTDGAVPYTRIVEHKYFRPVATPHTIVTWEYPEDWTAESEPFYPINDGRNQSLFENYQKLAQAAVNVIFGGRLASYRYYDMHQVIGSALNKVKHELECRGHIRNDLFAHRQSS